MGDKHIGRMRTERKWIGKTFGFLTVTAVHTKNTGRSRYVVLDVICKCGVQKTVGLANVRDGGIVSCGCKRRTPTGAYSLFGEPVSIGTVANLIDRSATHTGKMLQSATAEELLQKYKPETFRAMKLSKTKKRGRHLKTLEGREISHEELLRGLVHNQAVRDAS